MNMIEIIRKKRDKENLSRQEIEYFIKEYTRGNIPEEQAAAFIMATYINGMNEEETKCLTLAMAHSGDILDLSALGNVVDKHSTGGVGDKVTLILVPIVSALGIPVAKMSGRALGYTGGTIDKLESIPGYRVDLTEEEFKAQVQKIGISLIGQTCNLAPADKKLYALRDVIACTESIPLISSSIMSKKIAAGASSIVLEITCGNGAFMKTKEEAICLAKNMQKIGELCQKKVVAVITNMEEPLGYSVGNICEVIEANKALKEGNMAEDLKQVVIILGAYMLRLAGKGENIQKNRQRIEETIYSGKAYQKWLEWIEEQGGDISYLENPNLWKEAKYQEDICSLKDGFIAKIEARSVGEVVANLGAGRQKKEDNIDKEAGVIFYKKVADEVKQGEKIVSIYTNKKEAIEDAKKQLQKAIKIEENRPKKLSTILDVIE